MCNEIQYRIASDENFLILLFSDETSFHLSDTLIVAIESREKVRILMS